MSDSNLILIVTILLGFIFEFTNGFHDAANVVSTVIATRVLRPMAAIIMAATLNMIGATQTSKVAETLTQGILPKELSTQTIIIAALIGAILWNLLTWYFSVPSSSSYALIGGMIGSGIIAIGSSHIYWLSIIKKVLIPMIVSPIAGFILCLIIMKLFLRFISKKLESRSFHIFGKLQVLSAAFVAISHGFNDAQKTMAIITLALFTHGTVGSLSIPLWVIVSCAIVMALGTASGGFRIIRTVGFKISKLYPVQGFVAETGSSLMICLAAFLGFPLSTTQLIVGSIAGVGASKGIGQISSQTASRIGYAWVFTFPGSALLAAVSYYIITIKL
jgi:inorganic phosphate transporter, PiT family